MQHNHFILAAVLLACSACAANPAGPETSRPSAGTLVDESASGAYHAWEVLPVAGDDTSLVILAHGVDGTEAAIRFLPLDDGSLTIIAEADGTSSQLDIGEDGLVAGEAHAAAADAMLAEMVTDLDGRNDELVALAAGDGGSTAAGGAREALLAHGLDVECALVRLFGWGWNLIDDSNLHYEPACDAVLGRHSYLHFQIQALDGIAWARWSMGPSYVLPRSLAIRREGGRSFITADLPRHAVKRVVQFELQANGETEVRRVNVGTISPGHHDVNLGFWDECGEHAFPSGYGPRCRTNVCAWSRADWQYECVSSLHDEHVPEQ